MCLASIFVTATQYHVAFSLLCTCACSLAFVYHPTYTDPYTFVFRRRPRIIGQWLLEIHFKGFLEKMEIHFTGLARIFCSMRIKVHRIWHQKGAHWHLLFPSQGKHHSQLLRVDWKGCSRSRWFCECPFPCSTSTDPRHMISCALENWKTIHGLRVETPVFLQNRTRILF